MAKDYGERPCNELTGAYSTIPRRELHTLGNQLLLRVVVQHQRITNL